MCPFSAFGLTIRRCVACSALAFVQVGTPPAEDGYVRIGRWWRDDRTEKVSSHEIAMGSRPSAQGKHRGSQEATVKRSGFSTNKISRIRTNRLRVRRGR
ncbi:hypothetical protein L210DRAFT_2128801 [Boletus edulis BED1]|uniref:Secreted protein n=1 Tax=Boletus edulis BED1 TaxID=1328754 RepID=A0AAD4BVL4_BOLED|nr:hypothetical protein L210DRAFT_2128801 [Boletus edulis BED1]